ncbi:hypothetical protein FOXG_15927 [Fusarium oxysporum f. sp. lycopersici 4287]|uniref:Nik-1 protein (Os-1p protein) n=3 Tax=Fusarium oxysporum TaxID=5507 RepID=A0A0J9W628_FUSO4|nr:hypothetical protein FOXG_15927 [Fusarium oxysporum f. sp. lycopersici 4287]KNB18524.1 hypothetical protein FOXG_15927 [Fusarium oxysporum f. sp. lycopersici 4287]
MAPDSYDELLRANCRSICQVTSAGLDKSPNLVLTSLAQLATCQTKTERSLISLFDESKQYIIAEATPSTSLLSESSQENNGDGLWLCGTHIPRTDGVCHYTLCSTEVTSAELPIVIVQDLAIDPRFASSLYCRSGSLARFYAAVPIRTPRGINIGVLCVINSTPGAEWKDEYSKVLRGLSQTIMDHLEGSLIKNTLKRSIAMGRGFQKFTNRKMLPDECISSISKTNPDAYNPHNWNNNQNNSNIRQAHGNPSSSTETTPLEIPKPQCQKLLSSNPYLRASLIVKEVLQVDHCSFFSVDSRELHIIRSSETESKSDISLDGLPLCPSAYHSDSGKQSSNTQLQLPCQLLGSSNNSTSSTTKDGGDISQVFLSHMLQQYPEGCIFDMDLCHVSGLTSNYTADANLPRSKNNNETLGPAYEQRELLQAFPGACNITFIPIWDPLKGMVSIGGFAYSKAPRYQSDKGSELPFFRALGTLAASEACQIETLAADKAKSDVLGSISHELRSPLHGIMLGLELLNDSGLDAAQQNIAHLMETCCQTLLDTTEHLLDYSKVNQPVETDASHDGVSREVDPPQPLSQTVRLDQIAEDVVESVYAGHIYQHTSVENILSPPKSHLDTNFKPIKRLVPMQAVEINHSRQNNIGREGPDGDVHVFLLYDPRCRWSFQTHPGAVRRIIMNLFGNSLKYTSRGVIKVTVTQTQLDDAPNQRMITLTVEDTGRGISQDFLRNSIFIPFSQEDQLSSGTGLGLSFVQRITSQLGGNVSITSQVGVGTRVTVSLPMLIDTSSTATDLLPRELPDRQSTCHGLRMRLVSPIQNAGAAPHQEALSFNTLISDLCCEHLGMIMDTGSDVEKAAPDVLIVKNNATGDLLASATPWPEVPLLVVCNNAFVVHKYESVYGSAGRTRLQDFIAQPLSPKKLERAVSRAINLSAESDESPPKLVEMPLPTPSDTASCSQPPTPAPSSMESLFDGSIPAEDYFQVPQFLLVEDNPINLKMLTCFMKKLQKPYYTAMNGEEAVSAYKKVNGQFKYILMDISMPVMDGLEATRQIRAFEQFNKITASTIFAITGLGSESAREEATRSGVDCFITKPVKLRELEEMLSSQGVTI